MTPGLFSRNGLHQESFAHSVTAQGTKEGQALRLGGECGTTWWVAAAKGATGKHRGLEKQQ